jgi:hypothetical protein
MRLLAMTCAIVMLLASAVCAADRGVSKSALAEMGLATMQPLADHDALAVRGKGTFAGVWGGSVATWPGGQSSTNNYQAGSSWLGKPASAGGNSLSFAGRINFQGFGGR